MTTNEPFVVTFRFETHPIVRGACTLAEFSYRFNRRFSLSEMFPRLAFVALRTAPMPYRVLKLAENYP